MTPFLRSVLRGAAAGSAGTTALNAFTYLDMVIRARPASSTPETTVTRLSDSAGIDVPGDEEQRDNRVSGLGPLLGIAAGVGAGGVIGAARHLVHRGGPTSMMVGSAAVAMVVGNAPMTLAGVTDPRTWSLSSWIADVVPHAAYGVVTGLTLCQLDAQ